jgi:integrase
MRLAAVEPLHLREWLVTMEQKDLAPATIRKAYQILSRIFATAVNDGRLHRSPCRAIELPRVEVSKKRFLELDEVRSLADAIDERFRVLVLAAGYTGLRFGELAALRVGRFDPLRRSLRVEETLVEVRGNLYFGLPKTNASRRSVTVPRFLAEQMSHHIEVFPDPSDLIFTAPGGGPLRRSNFRRRFWIPAVERSVGSPCTFHDLRHTHAAILIAEGLHPKVIQDRMGHSSIKTTLDTYGHLLEGLDTLAAERLDTAYSRASEAWTDVHGIEHTASQRPA